MGTGSSVPVPQSLRVLLAEEYRRVKKDPNRDYLVTSQSHLIIMLFTLYIYNHICIYIYMLCVLMSLS